MKRMVYVFDMAQAINKLIEKQEYFWAVGLIKETISIWKPEMVMALLSEEGKQIARHYIKAEGG